MEVMRGPLISVVIPVHNAAHFLPDAIASIGSQGYEPFEILVVNDRSSDVAELERVCGLHANVRLMHLEGATGPAAARNMALREARGEYFTFLDADDLWTPHKTRIQAERLRLQPELDGLIGRTRMLSLNETPLPDVRYEDGVTFSFIHMATGLYRRRLFDSLGAFDPQLYFSEDFDWFLRLLESDHQVIRLRETFLIYRYHGTNMTLGLTAERSGMARILMRSLVRRRAKGIASARTWGALEELEAARISVVIPAYNAEQHLAAAVASVRAQTLPVSEVIVVDDGSSDGTATVAEGLGVRLIRQPNQGAPSARNAGIRVATGNQIAFLDADDAWRPTKLAEQWALLTAPPYPEMVFGDMEQVLLPAGSLLSRQAGVHLSAMLARRSAFEIVGEFDPTLRVGDFLDWYARARESGLQTAMTNTVVAERRIHGGNMMLRQPDGTQSYLKALKASLDRRRKASE